MRIHGAAAAAHDLGELRAELRHVAHLLTHAVHAIGFAAEIPGVAACDCDRLTTGDDARSDPVAKLQSTADMEDRTAEAANVAHRGDAGRERFCSSQRRRCDKHALRFAHRLLQ